MGIPETILSELLQVLKSEGIECHSVEELMTRLGVEESAYKGWFSSKADMVQRVVQYSFREREGRDRQMLQGAANPVEEIFLLLQDGIQELRSTNPVFLADLQQHYPQVWGQIMEHLHTYNYHLDLEVINKGVVQGYFRKDINLQLVTKIILEQFNMIINPIVFPPNHYELGEVFRSIYLYYVRGLCTDKGSKLAEEYFSKKNL